MMKNTKKKMMKRICNETNLINYDIYNSYTGRQNYTIFVCFIN
jgi:hypothetical protein